MNASAYGSAVYTLVKQEDNYRSLGSIEFIEIRLQNKGWILLRWIIMD